MSIQHIAGRAVLFLAVSLCATGGSFAQEEPDEPIDGELSSPFDHAIPDVSETDLPVLKKARALSALDRVQTLQAKLDVGVVVSSLDMLDGYEQLCEAELALAQNANERSEAAKKWFLGCWDYEQRKLAEFEAGRIGPLRDVVSEAIAARLEAQLAYVRACRSARIAPVMPEASDAGQKEGAVLPTETDQATLTQARIRVLEERSKDLRQMREQGIYVVDSNAKIQDAEHDVVQAILRSATTPQERVAALDRMYATAVENEAMAEAYSEAGVARGGPSDAVSNRLKWQAQYVAACQVAGVKPFPKELKWRGGASTPSTMESDVTKLRNARLETLRNAVAEEKAQFDAGIGGGPAHMKTALLELAEAELESTTNKRKRVDLLRRIYEFAAEIEEVNRAGFESGQTGRESVSGAIANRLKAQIDYVDACNVARIKPFSSDAREVGEPTSPPNVDQIRNRSVLGVQIQDTPRGVVVLRVQPDGPAAEAGVRAGDVILRVNGQRYRSVRDLVASLAEMRDGERPRLEIFRNDFLFRPYVELADRDLVFQETNAAFATDRAGGPELRARPIFDADLDALRDRIDALEKENAMLQQEINRNLGEAEQEPPKPGPPSSELDDADGEDAAPIPIPVPDAGQ